MYWFSGFVLRRISAQRLIFPAAFPTCKYPVGPDAAVRAIECNVRFRSSSSKSGPSAVRPEGAITRRVNERPVSTLRRTAANDGYVGGLIVYIDQPSWHVPLGMKHAPDIHMGLEFKVEN